MDIILFIMIFIKSNTAEIQTVNGNDVIIVDPVYNKTYRTFLQTFHTVDEEMPLMCRKG